MQVCSCLGLSKRPHSDLINLSARIMHLITLALSHSILSAPDILALLATAALFSTCKTTSSSSASMPSVAWPGVAMARSVTAAASNRIWTAGGESAGSACVSVMRCKKITVLVPGGFLPRAIQDRGEQFCVCIKGGYPVKCLTEGHREPGAGAGRCVSYICPAIAGRYICVSYELHQATSVAGKSRLTELASATTATATT